MSSSKEIKKRLSLLRKEMQSAGAAYYLMCSTDPHGSENISDHYKVTEFISGCTSDNAVVIVGEEFAGLWTDGRYFISAAAELADTGITLMKSGMPGVPTVEAFLEENLKEGQMLAFDGLCVKGEDGWLYREAASKNGATIDGGLDLITPIWMNRPPLLSSPVTVLPEEVHGCDTAAKLAMVREAMEKANAAHFFVSGLDEIMWLLNIRGSDICCSPVAMSYALVGAETVDVFLKKEAVTRDLEKYARSLKIKIHDYDDILKYLGHYHFEGRVLTSEDNISYALAGLIDECSDGMIPGDPIPHLKALKNQTEIENMKRFYLLDSACLCRFLSRIEKMAGRESFNEYDAACLIDKMRGDIPGFAGLSFPTISAYCESAAMAHYSADEKSSKKVEPRGFLLVDSGGQYLGATTDVTRTVAVGPLTDEMKKDFTLVAASCLSLMYTRFAAGTTGSQLDMVAREKLYKYGIDYNHGTGHGVGCMLNVHEGPQRICKSGVRGGNVPFEAGMVTSDEPGVYKEGRYGIRTENILLTVADVKNEFGEFLRFEPLTYVPIDIDAIDTAYMEREDIERLNAYHKEVRERISPLLYGEELEWLIRKTREI